MSFTAAIQCLKWRIFQSATAALQKLFIFNLHARLPPVTSSLGGGVPVWRWLLLGLLLLGQRLLQPGAFPGVVLPVQQLLLVDELGTLSVDQLLPEVFILQQLQHVEAVRIPAEEEETGGVTSLQSLNQETSYPRLKEGRRPSQWDNHTDVWSDFQWRSLTHTVWLKLKGSVCCKTNYMLVRLSIMSGSESPLVHAEDITL